jgi:hypothetical protein
MLEHIRTGEFRSIGAVARAGRRYRAVLPRQQSRCDNSPTSQAARAAMASMGNRRLPRRVRRTASGGMADPAASVLHLAFAAAGAVLVIKTAARVAGRGALKPGRTCICMLARPGGRCISTGAGAPILKPTTPHRSRPPAQDLGSGCCHRQHTRDAPDGEVPAGPAQTRWTLSCAHCRAVRPG